MWYSGRQISTNRNRTKSNKIVRKQKNKQKLLSAVQTNYLASLVPLNNSETTQRSSLMFERYVLIKMFQ